MNNFERFLIEVIDTPPWMQHAACRGMNPEMFYPAKSEFGCGKNHPAKAVCSGCSVKKECLELGLQKREQGIWGGTSEKQRRVIRRRRREEAA